VSEDPRFASKLIKAKPGKDYVLLSQDADPMKRVKGVRMLLKKTLSPVPDKYKKSKGKYIVKNKKMLKAQKVKKLIPDKNPTANALLPRFLDDSNLVVSVLLKVKVASMLKIFTEPTLADKYVEVLKKHLKFNIKSSKVLKLVTLKLCKLACRSSNNKQFQNKVNLFKIRNDQRAELLIFILWYRSFLQVLNLILPMMFPASDDHLKLPLAILKTKFAKANNFLSRFAYSKYNFRNWLSI